MTKSEQATLKAMASSLKKSTQTSWSSGDVNDFKNWASVMRSRINMACEIIDELCSLPPDSNSPEETEGDIKLD